MKLIVTATIALFLFPVFLSMLSSTSSSKQSGESGLPVEAGFLSYEVSQLPFSMQFFLILIIFVIFDLEVLFLVNTPTKQSEDFFSLFLLLYFILLSLFLEWMMGKLIWV